MKHELYLKEQEVMQKKLAEGIAENLQKQRTKKEAQYMKLWKEVEVQHIRMDQYSAGIKF